MVRGYSIQLKPSFGVTYSQTGEVLLKTVIVFKKKPKPYFYQNILTFFKVYYFHVKGLDICFNFLIVKHIYLQCISEAFPFGMLRDFTFDCPWSVKSILQRILTVYISDNPNNMTCFYNHHDEQTDIYTDERQIFVSVPCMLYVEASRSL